MKFDVTYVEPLHLKMVETIYMPESIRNDKGDFEKTGKKVEMTGYYLFNDKGEKMYIMSAKNEFRQYEGRHVNASFTISYSDFDKKFKVSLSLLDPVKKA